MVIGGISRIPCEDAGARGGHGGDTRGVGRNALLGQLIQALIQLSAAGFQERSTLESLSDHIASRGGMTAPR
jgi:hypothetical protein